MPDFYLTHEQAERAFLRCGHQFLPRLLNQLYYRMTPADRYEFTLDAYTMAPYGSIPKQRIIDLKKIKPADYLKDLDADLSDADPITVYRGGSLDPKAAKLSLSWTTDIYTACFFWCIKSERGYNPGKVWTGVISKAVIIATNNDRSEHEIIQYNSVRDIKAVEMTEANIKEAAEEYKRRIKEDTEAYLSEKRKNRR